MPARGGADVMGRGCVRIVSSVSLVGWLLLLPVMASDRPVSGGQGNDETFMRLLVAASEALTDVRLERAEQLFTEALRLRPESRDARFGMGTLFIKQRRYGEAIATMEALIEDYPNEFPIINNLAWLYATATDAGIRDGNRAVHLAQEALLLQPNNYHVWSTLSEGHFVLGHYERAARAAREALRLSREAGAGEGRIRTYQRQLEKCVRAAQAMTILD